MGNSIDLNNRNSSIAEYVVECILYLQINRANSNSIIAYQFVTVGDFLDLLLLLSQVPR